MTNINQFDHYRAAILVLLATACLAVIPSCTRRESPREVPPVAVVMAEVNPIAIASANRYSATLDAAEGSTLSFTTIGTVQRVYVREGQYVKKGTLLAELDAAQVQSAYNATKALLDQAEDAYNRSKPLYEKGLITKIQWVDIETKRLQAISAEAIALRALDDTRLVSPCSGHIAALNIDAGQNVAIGVPVMRVVDMNSMKVEFSVPEREVSKFRIGLPLKGSVAALGGKGFDAVVTEVGVVADRLSRTYKVSASVSGPTGDLRAGMICEVWRDNGTETAIAIPASAVQLDADGSQFVWTVEDGFARKHTVLADAYVGDSVVVHGLPQGTSLIVKGQQKVSSGMAVTVKN